MNTFTLGACFQHELHTGPYFMTFAPRLLTEIHNFLSTDRLRKVQSNLCLRAPFFRPSGQKNRYIDPCTKPLYNGNFLLSPRWPLKGGLTVVLQVPKSLTFKTRLRAKPFL